MRVVVPVDVFPSNSVELLCCDGVDRQLRDGGVVANATATARRTDDTAGQQASTTPPRERHADRHREREDETSPAAGPAEQVRQNSVVNRVFRAGETVEDACRSCKVDRFHTVIVVDGTGRPIRVSCDFCGSQHNFRGGPREDARSASPVRTPFRPSAAPDPLPLVSDRERTSSRVSDAPSEDLELLLRRIIREEIGLTPVAPAAKWRGGSLILRPGTPGLQDKSWPIETFFHKVVMLRNRLRTLEQQVNASELPDDVKVKLQGYVSGCYGSLTSFNILFADEADQFKGSSGGD